MTTSPPLLISISSWQSSRSKVPRSGCPSNVRISVGRAFLFHSKNHLEVRRETFRAIRQQNVPVRHESRIQCAQQAARQGKFSLEPRIQNEFDVDRPVKTCIPITCRFCGSARARCWRVFCRRQLQGQLPDEPLKFGKTRLAGVGAGSDVEDFGGLCFQGQIKSGLRLCSRHSAAWLFSPRRACRATSAFQP